MAEQSRDSNEAEPTQKVLLLFSSRLFDERGARGSDLDQRTVSPSADMYSNPSSSCAHSSSFGSVLASLEAPSNPKARANDDLESFLRAHIAQLKAPHAPFPRNAASKAKITAGTIKEGNLDVRLDTAQQAVVLSIAERFEMDEVEAWRILSRTKVRNAVELNDQEWDAVTAAVFEERMAVIAIIGFLLRCG